MLDDAVEEKDGGEKVRIGTVVIRGNSVVMLEVRVLRSSAPLPAEWFLTCGIGIGENKLKKRLWVLGTGEEWGFWEGSDILRTKGEGEARFGC